MSYLVEENTCYFNDTTILCGKIFPPIMRDFHVPMSKFRHYADERTNKRFGHSMNLNQDIKKAFEINKHEQEFINRNNTARVNGLQIYTDILSKHRQVIIKSIPCRLIAEQDFKSKFTLIDKTTAVECVQSNTPKIDQQDDQTQSSTPDLQNDMSSDDESF